MTNTDPFEINKAEKGPFRRPSFQNTRKENTKVGAVVGASTWGGLGGAAGAHIGTKEAKRGIKVLDEVGAHPGRLRAAKLVAGHAGKTGAALGAAGAVSGAAVGGLVGAMEGSKGGKYGEQDRKYAIQSAKMRADRLNRKAAKSRASAKEFSKSAFGVDHNLEKAWKGTKGDKRNSKYFGSALAGSTAGKHIGARAAGTNQKTMTEAQRGESMLGAMGGEGFAPRFKSVLQVRGAKPVIAGDMLGAVGGGAAYHAYRKKKGIAKSAFGIEH